MIAGGVHGGSWTGDGASLAVDTGTLHQHVPSNCSTPTLYLGEVRAKENKTSNVTPVLTL